MLTTSVSTLETINMAAQGKHSPLTFKAMACSAGVFLVAWAAINLLDTHFDLTLMAGTTGWLLRLGDWLLLETPMPNWSLLMIIAVFNRHPVCSDLLRPQHGWSLRRVT